MVWSRAGYRLSAATDLTQSISSSRSRGDGLAQLHSSTSKVQSPLLAAATCGAPGGYTGGQQGKVEIT